SATMMPNSRGPSRPRDRCRDARGHDDGQSVSQNTRWAARFHEDPWQRRASIAIMGREYKSSAPYSPATSPCDAMSQEGRNVSAYGSLRVTRGMLAGLAP